MGRDMAGLFEKTLRWLKGQAEKAGGASRLADRLSAPRATFYKVLNGKQTNAKDYLSWLDALGIHVIFPDESHDTTRPIRFLDATVLWNGRHDHLPQPTPDRYRAIPVVSGEVAAGEGLLPEEGIESWMILSTVEPAVRRSSNLLAVRVGRRQRSMLPLIHPGATVLVDCDDRAPAGESSIYLVRDPHDGRALKKVRTFTRHNEEFVTFYSLNAEEYPPFTYSVDKDFEGNLKRAIVGRVVWLWQDLTGA